MYLSFDSGFNYFEPEVFGANWSKVKRSKPHPIQMHRSFHSSYTKSAAQFKFVCSSICIPANWHDLRLRYANRAACTTSVPSFCQWMQYANREPDIIPVGFKRKSLFIGYCSTLFEPLININLHLKRIQNRAPLNGRMGFPIYLRPQQRAIIIMVAVEWAFCIAMRKDDNGEQHGEW